MKTLEQPMTENTRREGMLITLEGIDGAGKSTQVETIASVLKEYIAEEYIVKTREPGGTPLAEHLRSLGLSELDKNGYIASLLFAAAHKHHEQFVVLPSLNEGKFVISDRYSDSGVVYASLMSDEVSSLLDTINRTEGEREPDLTLWLAVTPSEAMRRLKQRGESNLFDEQPEDLYFNLHTKYSELCRRNTRRIVQVDADRSEEEVAERIRAVVRSFMRARGYVSL